MHHTPSRRLFDQNHQHEEPHATVRDPYHSSSTSPFARDPVVQRMRREEEKMDEQIRQIQDDHARAMEEHEQTVQAAGLGLRAGRLDDRLASPSTSSWQGDHRMQMHELEDRARLREMDARASLRELDHRAKMRELDDRVQLHSQHAHSPLDSRTMLREMDDHMQRMTSPLREHQQLVAQAELPKADLQPRHRSGRLVGFGSNFGFPSMDLLVGRMEGLMRDMEEQEHAMALAAGELPPPLLGAEGESTSVRSSENSFSQTSPDGRVMSHTSRTERRRVGDVAEEESHYQDSFGNERIATRHAIDQRVREVVRHRNAHGEEVATENLHGLKAADVPAFESAWNRAWSKAEPPRQLKSAPTTPLRSRPALQAPSTATPVRTSYAARPSSAYVPMSEPQARIRRAL